MPWGVGPKHKLWVTRAFTTTKGCNESALFWENPLFYGLWQDK